MLFPATLMVRGGLVGNPPNEQYFDITFLFLQSSIADIILRHF